MRSWNKVVETVSAVSLLAVLAVWATFLLNGAFWKPTNPLYQIIAVLAYNGGSGLIVLIWGVVHTRLISPGWPANGGRNA